MTETQDKESKKPFVFGYPRVWFSNRMWVLVLGIISSSSFGYVLITMSHDNLVYKVIALSVAITLFAVQMIMNMNYKRSYPVGKLYYDESKLPCPCCGFHHSTTTDSESITCQECGTEFTISELIDAWKKAEPRQITYKYKG